VAIEDVTERVNRVLKSDMPTAEAFRARRAAGATIEETSLAKSGLRSDVITLYGGAQYHVYRYKKYTDVRLVWAPETKATFFGGDPNNFQYPRYCLDVHCFGSKRMESRSGLSHLLKFSKDGADENELVFVSGNPRRTQHILRLQHSILWQITGCHTCSTTFGESGFCCSITAMKVKSKSDGRTINCWEYRIPGTYTCECSKGCRTWLSCGRRKSKTVNCWRSCGPMRSSKRNECLGRDCGSTTETSSMAGTISYVRRSSLPHRRAASVDGGRGRKA